MKTQALIPRNTLLGAGLLLAIGTAIAASTPLQPHTRLEIAVGTTTMSRGLVELGPSEFGDAWFRFMQDADGRTLAWHSNGRALIGIDATTREPVRYVSESGETLEPIFNLRRSDVVPDERWIAFDFEAPGPSGPRKATRHTDGCAHIDVFHSDA